MSNEEVVERLRKVMIRHTKAMRIGGEVALARGPSRRAKRPSGPSRSGCRKREDLKLKAGTAAFERHKWGRDVAGARRRQNRKTWLMRRPARA